MLSQVSGSPPVHEEYPSLEREQVVAEFALQILRARDGKTRGIKANGHILNLAKELVKAASATGIEAISEFEGW